MEFKVGDSVTLYFAKKSEDKANENVVYGKRLKIIGLYKTYMLTQDEKGMKECFSYTEARQRQNRRFVKTGMRYYKIIEGN